MGVCLFFFINTNPIKPIDTPIIEAISNIKGKLVIPCQAPSAANNLKSPYLQKHLSFFFASKKKVSRKKIAKKKKFREKSQKKLFSQNVSKNVLKASLAMVFSL